MRMLDDRVGVAGQIGAEDMPALAASGVTMIVNNRPDGEEPGQPADADLRRAAEAAGIGWAHVPMAGQLSPELIAAMGRALDGEARTLAFCRSGTRSTWLWATARAAAGADPHDLVARAAAADHDLAAARPLLDRLAADYSSASASSSSA